MTPAPAWPNWARTAIWLVAGAIVAMGAARAEVRTEVDRSLVSIEKRLERMEKQLDKLLTQPRR